MQLQTTLEKIYHPGADKIVDGLSQFNDRAATNMLGAHEQSIEATHLLQKDIHQNDPNNAVNAGLLAQDGALVDQNQWAHEVRRADERCEQYQNVVNELQSKLKGEIQFTEELTGKIKVRDQEILRLHELYQPAQNLEKLNLKFQYEQNENSVKKLQNQVDFLNRENDKLQKQCDLLKGDGEGNMAVAQYDAMKKEVDELAFQNQTLRKDYEECRRQLSLTQSDLNRKLVEEQDRVRKEREAQELLQKQQEELVNQKGQTLESQEKNHSLKSAFNADRQVLLQKIDDLEAKLSNRIREVQGLEQKIHILMQNEQSQKNELNFWNGKVTTLRRDAEYQQIFAENMQNENRKM